jgi:outer membrane protein
MKTLITTIILGLALISANVSAEQGKIAVVDMQQAIMMTDRAREQIKSMESEKEYAATLEKFEGLRNKLRDMQKEMEVEGKNWTEKQRMEFSQNGEFVRKEYELQAEKIKMKNQEIMRLIQKEMGETVRDTLKELIDAEGIDLVLDANLTFYAAPRIDLTNKLTEKLNEADK